MIVKSPRRFVACSNLRRDDPAHAAAQRAGAHGGAADLRGEHLRRVHEHDREARRRAELPDQGQGDLEAQL